MVDILRVKLYCEFIFDEYMCTTMFISQVNPVSLKVHTTRKNTFGVITKGNTQIVSILNKSSIHICCLYSEVGHIDYKI